MCGESCMHGVERGKIRRLYQRITYRYPGQMLMCGKVTHKNLIESSPTIPKIKGKINRFLKTCMVKYDYE